MTRCAAPTAARPRTRTRARAAPAAWSRARRAGEPRSRRGRRPRARSRSRARLAVLVRSVEGGLGLEEHAARFVELLRQRRRGIAVLVAADAHDAARFERGECGVGALARLEDECGVLAL